jgi:hypothetical protein
VHISTNISTDLEEPIKVGPPGGLPLAFIVLMDIAGGRGLVLMNEEPLSVPKARPGISYTGSVGMPQAINTPAL